MGAETLLASPLLALEPAEFWALAALAAGVMLAAFYGTFRFWQRARLIEDTPTARIRSAAQGYVELDGVGRLLEGPPIVAPLTRRPCTWWRYRIERKVRSGRHSRWQTVEGGVSEALFLLEDDTGRCLVDPDGAEVTPAMRERWYGASPSPPGGPASGVWRWFGGEYRYTEERMHPGDPLYALGWFTTQRASGSALETAQAVSAKLAHWKRDPGMLRERFDADGDGTLDMQEWEAAREAAAREVAAAESERALAPGLHVMRRPPDGRPYLLSVLPQRDLARRLRLKSFACLVLFFACGVTLVYAVGTRLAA